MEAFQILEVTGDVGIAVSGSDLQELFRNAAFGLYYLITPTKVSNTKRIEVSVSSIDMESLLINWLNELIFRFDVEGFVGNSVEFEFLTDTELKAIVRGGIFDKECCEKGSLIKAATYHGLEIKKKSDGYYAKIIFDI